VCAAKREISFKDVVPLKKNKRQITPQVSKKNWRLSVITTENSPPKTEYIRTITVASNRPERYEVPRNSFRKFPAATICEAARRIIYQTIKREEKFRTCRP